jgi:hypothetical protein
LDKFLVGAFYVPLVKGCRLFGHLSPPDPRIFRAVMPNGPAPITPQKSPLAPLFQRGELKLLPLG